MRHFLFPTILSLLCGLVFTPSASWADTRLKYQDRGTYHEGIKPKPVAGYDLELISVLADYREPSTALPEKLKIRFFLPEKAEVYLTVRELDYRLFYWLDKVTPSESWTKGFDNTFTWVTSPVLQDLDQGMNMYELGVLARLGNENPASKEHIAPVILYHSSPPTTVKGYWFTLKPNGLANVVCAVYAEKSNTAVWDNTFRRKPAGQPFSVKWDASQAQEGPYEFNVTGYFLENNQRINQTIIFYHQPFVK